MQRATNLAYRRFFSKGRSQVAMETSYFQRVLSIRLIIDHRAFVARQMIFQRSLGLDDLLNPEDWCGLSDFMAVATNNSKYSGRSRDLRRALLVVPKLLVEEPLVDLDPGQACNLNRLPSLVAI